MTYPVTIDLRTKPEEAKMEKTNKPTVAGVFNIITGALGILGALGAFFGFGVVTGAFNIPTGYIPDFVPAIVLGSAIFSLIVAVLALIGGIFAVQRKQWGWALTGSIAAIFSLIFLGIPAVILVATSKNEFE
ncbi:hypothetical protein ACFLTP_09380 [Chloroflexota bacterium]